MEKAKEEEEEMYFKMLEDLNKKDNVENKND